MTALLLGLLYVFQRRFMLYDHFIFAMHSLAFLAIVFLVFLLLASWLGAPATWLLLILPVNLFRHLRGTYGSGVPGALVRMTVLFTGACVAAVGLSLLLVAIGLEALPGG